jgi:hypothetical protein
MEAGIGPFHPPLFVGLVKIVLAITPTVNIKIGLGVYTSSA